MPFRKIVVTGARGQLGQALCRMLGPVAVPTDLPELDITSAKDLWHFLESVSPDAVINAAAFTRVDAAEDQPELAHAVNAQAVAYLAEYCRRKSCPLVQVSTDYVFGGDQARFTPYREEDPVAPVNVYGRTKWEGEQHARSVQHHVIVRTCGLYGELGANSPGNFVETILRKAQSGQTLRVVDDQVCSPSYVPHVARALLFLLQGHHWGTYHVVNAGQTSWFGFARKIIQHAGLTTEVIPIRSGEYPAKAKRPGYSVLDCSKYLGLRGAPPLPPWDEALREYLIARQSWLQPPAEG